MSATSDFKDLLSELSTADVRYLVVGGYAVAFHAEPRFTKDFDIWIDRDPINAERAREALERFGAPTTDLSVEDLTRGDQIFQIGVEPNRIDILTAIDGVEFSEAWQHRIAGRLGDASMWVISREDLIRNKRASGRPQDLLDVQALERAGR